MGLSLPPPPHQPRAVGVTGSAGKWRNEAMLSPVDGELGMLDLFMWVGDKELDAGVWPAVNVIFERFVWRNALLTRDAARLPSRCMPWQT